VTLPIALLILLFACGGPALAVLLTLPATFLSSFMLLTAVAGDGKHGTLAFASFTPAIFLNTLIAVTLDYALFILSRYRSEVNPFSIHVHMHPQSVSFGGKSIFNTCSHAMSVGIVRR
jgi:uncharacterized membrane protein YdfJ with MMPL/SSD domain